MGPAPKTPYASNETPCNPCNPYPTLYQDSPWSGITQKNKRHVSFYGQANHFLFFVAFCFCFRPARRPRLPLSPPGFAAAAALLIIPNSVALWSYERGGGGERHVLSLAHEQFEHTQGSIAIVRWRKGARYIATKSRSQRDSVQQYTAANYGTCDCVGTTHPSGARQDANIVKQSGRQDRQAARKS